jgi:DNA polymerase-3 subunit epsilon
MKLFSYFHSLEKLRREKHQFLQNVHVPKLLLPILQQPEVEIDTDANSLEYIVLDIETTGLDSKKDIILSMGWVKVSNSTVHMDTAHHYYINDSSQINPKTAVINHITPETLASGVSIHDAMTTFIENAENCVIVAHACFVETAFINQYFKQAYGYNGLPLLWVDTLQIEKNLCKAIDRTQCIDVTLMSSRLRYGLPEYMAHNALIDAVATAELFIAQTKRLFNKSNVTIGKLHQLSIAKNS